MESLAIALLRSCLNSPTVLGASHITCKQVLFEHLAKILSGGRSSRIVDLTQKLRERPTPKFSEAVASCGGGGGEFVEPLTECPGTKNGKRGHQKVFSEPNKSRINSLTRKEKTTVRSSGFALTHPFG